MRLILYRRGILLCLIICCGVFSRAGQNLELTRIDPVTDKDWSSSQISVFGLGLGMTRSDAVAAAKSSGLELIQDVAPYYKWLPCSDSLSCFLSNAKRNRVAGVTITFSEAGKITDIDLQFDLETPGILLPKLRGATGELFGPGYSDALRLRLLGAPSSVVRFSGRYGEKFPDTKYVYANRGISLVISPTVGEPEEVRRKRAEVLTHVEFFPPGIGPRKE